jgi:hypothetical protein
VELREAIEFCLLEAQAADIVTEAKHLEKKITTLVAAATPEQKMQLLGTKKVLWKHRIDDVKGQLVVSPRSKLAGSAGVAAQAKELKKLGKELLGLAEDSYPEDKMAELCKTEKARPPARR